MRTSSLRWPALAGALGLFAALSSGCIATDGGYGYGPGAEVGVGVDYYEPYAGDYGGWGPGYRVGPYRGGGDHGDGNRGGGGGDRGGGDRGGGNRGGGQGGHAFRSAPASRSMPSIPSHAGGGRGGGHSR